MFFKEKQSPKNAWAVPFVTGHRYHVHWEWGLDFEQMRVQLSDRWEATDETIYFHSNYTDVREAFNFTDTATGEQIEEYTLFTNPIADADFGINYA